MRQAGRSSIGSRFKGRKDSSQWLQNFDEFYFHVAINGRSGAKNNFQLSRRDKLQRLVFLSLFVPLELFGRFELLHLWNFGPLSAQNLIPWNL